MIESVVQHSMLRQAVEREKVELHLVNLRDFGEGNYRQIDDTPFGGGPGMVMMAGPLFKAIENAIEKVGGKMILGLFFPHLRGYLGVIIAQRKIVRLRSLLSYVDITRASMRE